MNAYLRIDEILKIQKKSLSQLAKALGITRGNLIVSLSNNPNLELLKRIALFLDVNLSDLFIQKNSVFGIIQLEAEGKKTDYKIFDLLSLKKAIRAIEKTSSVNCISQSISIKDRIDQILISKGLSIDDFHKAIGRTKQNFLKSIVGNPKLQTLVEISNVLDIELNELFKQDNDFRIRGQISINGESYNLYSIQELIELKKAYKELSLNSSSMQEIDTIIENVLADVKDIDIESAPIMISEITIDKVEQYDARRTNCWSFRSRGDTRNGIILNLGNMVLGYPFEMYGHRFYDSECAYIAGCYSHNGEQYLRIQEELSNYKIGGYNAKREYRKAKNEKTVLIRKDWETFNFQWMLLVLWNKCQSNAEFRKLLLDIPENAQIIEDSTILNGKTSSIWGAKNPELNELRNRKAESVRKRLQEHGITSIATINQIEQIIENRINTVGTWTGKNLMGKALKLCQLALIDNTIPPIDYDLLKTKDIYWFGKKLEKDFTKTFD